MSIELVQCSINPIQRLSFAINPNARSILVIIMHQHSNLVVQLETTYNYSCLYKDTIPFMICGFESKQFHLDVFGVLTLVLLFGFVVHLGI